jgi:hypothetical protein
VPACALGISTYDSDSHHGILAACLAVGLGAAAQQQPTFRGTADNVRVFTTVMDRDGRLVTSLEQKDFEIRDEGKPQPITLFDNSPQPIRLIVLLDVSAAWRAICSCSAKVPGELFKRLRMTMPFAWARLDTR